MTLPTAPRITSAELSSPETLPGVAIMAVVSWDGEPRVQPTFQWRNGDLILRGETGGSYTPAAAMPSLNCVIRVDNGRGSAVAVARLEPVEASPVATEFTYETDVYETGVYE